MNANEMNHNPLSRTTNESFECNRSPETLPRSMFSPSVAILTKRESFNNGNSENIQNLRRRRADVLQIKNIRRLPTATTATLMHATMSKAIVSSRTTVGTIAKCTKFHQNRDSLIVGLILFAVCLSASVADASSKSNQNSQNTGESLHRLSRNQLNHFGDVTTCFIGKTKRRKTTPQPDMNLKDKKRQKRVVFQVSVRNIARTRLFIVTSLEFNSK